MTKVINVLDHGLVRLVDSMGSDLSIARSARVSYDAAWRAGENEKSDTKLINYLWRNGHTTPFENVTFTFEIKAPLFVLAQWQRHRTWSYNQISARYCELPEVFYVPEPNDIGVQSKSNKQMRVHEDKASANNVLAAILMREANAGAFRTYRFLLEKGVPRELARSVLPTATYSHMFATVNLLNLLKFLSLRTHEHAQKEIQVYAHAMLELIKPIVPVAVAAWETEKEAVKSK